jgi:hypothetical protein
MGVEEQFIWRENAKVMYEKVIEATPWLFRHFTRSGLNKGLTGKGCGEVTEDIMYQVVREVTPAAHLEASLKILDENKTPNFSAVGS